ncbi:MAG TPA: hypothetical protein VGR57_03165 [Ktedonobacterales bacterium]|nr:hypothetical protein [Ktedonobacterales bacterium]
MPRQRYEPPEPTGWARQWLDAIKSFDPQNEERLARGAVDARRGIVLEEAVVPGEIQAAVVRSTVYDPALVTIRIVRFSDAEWQRVAAAFAAQAHLAARLLAGEVPLELNGVLAGLGLALVPQSPAEITATCTCRQGHKLCPHVAAAHYILATNLEQQPFLLFTLRGRDLTILLDDMRAVWEGQPAPDEDEAADPDATPADHHEMPNEPLRAVDFYRAGPALDALRITIAPPQVEAALLKRLGRPPFATPEEDPIPALTSVYAAVTRRALATQGRAERRTPGRG